MSCCAVCGAGPIACAVCGAFQVDMPLSEPQGRELTWDQLKALVDAKLAELGKDGSIGIQYIDISWPYASEERSITIDLDRLAVL